MFNVILAGGHMYGKQLFPWLSLVVSLTRTIVKTFVHILKMAYSKRNGLKFSVFRQHTSPIPKTNCRDHFWAWF